MPEEMTCASLAVLAALALSLGTAGASPAAGSAEGVAASYEVRLADVDEVYAADAIIEAVRQATVAAQLSGTVVEVLVDAGDRVRRGQVLARIDTRDVDARVEAAQAGVAQADARLAQARLELERTRSLLAQNFVSKAALDRAEADYLAARAAADAARADNSRSRTARSYAELKSPIDGVVTRRLLDPGEFAAPGTGVVQVHDPAALRAVGNLPQGMLARAAQVQQARIELPQPGRSFAATRITILPSADARLLSTQVRAELPPGEVAGVLPGAAAKILLVVGRVRRLVVPESTLIRRGELVAVNVVAADGKPQLRQVRLGTAQSGSGVEVLAGLTEGERVLVNPLAAATAGVAPAPVAPRRGGEPARR